VTVASSNQNKKRNDNMILVDRRESVARITLNRPAEQNVLDWAMVSELSRVFTELQHDSGVRAVILTGAGGFFSAGVDAGEFSALTPEQAKSLVGVAQAVTSLIEDLGKPVIAAINGVACGGGCELALACTWRVASLDSVFVLPEVALGRLLGFGGTTRLSGLIGKARALEMILTGEPINAEEALRIGLIHRILAQPEELLPFCERLAHQISRNAPLAIKYALEAINQGSQLSLADGLRLESALFGLCFATRDVEEGTKAFLEKRQPEFKGH